MSRVLFLVAAALPLAACDRAEQGTSISLNVADGNVIGAVDGKSGEVKLNVPGFSGKITLPKVQLDASNFDLDGVKLYPGTTVDSMNVAGGDKRNQVVIAFTSPAAPDAVRGWFEQRLAAAGYTIAASSSGLAGTTPDDKPFALELSPGGTGQAKGRITLGG